jgi:voltage-gated potassium channel
MDSLDSYPSRNLIRGSVFMLVVWCAATAAYWKAGWSFQDALYMVTLTVFTVGYGEVRPIDTTYLHVVTMATMAFGCTGMIFLTGSLIQFMTLNSLQQLLGGRRVQAEVDKLKNHVIVCGYGRIGVELAKALKDGRADVVVLEQDASSRRAKPVISAFRAMPPTRPRCRTPASIVPARSPAYYRTTPPMSSLR